jgi:hypothetical protein
MRNLKRILITGCAASILLGAVGTFNSSHSSLGTQSLLAWDHRDQDSYNRGYPLGREDARANRRADSGRRWDADFRRGYEDGYNRESRGRDRSGERYGRNDGYNGNWGSDRYGSRNSDGYYSGPGRMSWRGRVDDYVELRIQGNRVRSIERGGAPTYNEQASFSNPLPRADVRVDLKKRDGRGRVSLLEQPSRYNNYTAVIRIDDNKGGADDYEIEMQWR